MATSLTPKVNLQNQRIGVYLHRGFGNVRYRFLRGLGSTPRVACVVELVYPAWANGIIVGIPRGVVSERRSLSPPPRLGGA